jgi:hypothetical protein
MRAAQAPYLSFSKDIFESWGTLWDSLLTQHIPKPAAQAPSADPPCNINKSFVMFVVKRKINSSKIQPRPRACIYYPIASLDFFSWYFSNLLLKFYDVTSKQKSSNIKFTLFQGGASTFMDV